MIKTQLELEGQGRKPYSTFLFISGAWGTQTHLCAATIKDLSTFLTCTIISGFDHVDIYPYSFLN